MKTRNLAAIGLLAVIISLFFIAMKSNGNLALSKRNNSVKTEKRHLSNQMNSAETDGLLFHESFENADFKKKWFRSDVGASYSTTRSDSIASDGKYSLRVQLNRYDPLVAGSRRAELVSYLEKSSMIDRWYSFDIFLPETYKADSIPETLAQWHVQTTAAQKNMSITPPLSLRVEYDHWRLWVLYALRPAGNTEKYYGTKTFELPKLEPGKWSKWIFHIKYSHGNDGLLQVWQNGVSKIDYKGPNFYDTEMGPYFKIGIYKPAWHPDGYLSPVTQRVVFYDNIKIGDETMNWAKMSGK